MYNDQQCFQQTIKLPRGFYDLCIVSVVVEIFLFLTALKIVILRVRNLQATI